MSDAKVKAEFLLPIPEVPKEPVSEENVQPKAEDKRTKPPASSSFKKRPRDKRPDPSTLLCRAVAAGEGCAYADGVCKFSHDLEGYFATREKDLGSVCPVFAALGYCRFGLKCRFATSHIDLETKANFPKPEGHVLDVGETNIISVDMKVTLRKEKYAFKSMDRKGKAARNRNAERSLPEGTTRELIELPERKLIDFKGKIYVAPLTTVGNLPFRRIMKQFQADITCGEMAMSQKLLQGNPSEWALLKRHKSEDVFGVQIAGAYRDQMSRVSELLAKETDADFIDINMGCPIDLVCDTGAGSALMRDKRKLEDVVRAALTGIELGSAGKSHMPELTVKMRTGWNSNDRTAHKFLPIVQKCRSMESFMNPRDVKRFQLPQSLSVAAYTIHGRSRLMRYTKTADWDYVCQAADARLPVDEQHPYVSMIGGGDVLSYEEFHQHLESGQLDTCMLARGALIKPWLPTEIKDKRHWDISSSERLDILRNFVTFGLEHWGSDQQGVNTTRRFLLEWLSFLCRYIPVGLLEELPQHINHRPPAYVGRNDLETLMGSREPQDWVKLSEMLLGPVPADFAFVAKHKANSFGAVSRNDEQ